MHIGSIVTVGIDNQVFAETLEEHGYTIVPVDNVNAVLDISDPFDIMLVRGELLSDLDNATLEHFYFVNSIPAY
jgi:hypothetical protein